MAKTTITDVPRKGIADKDKLGLLAYEQGLENFLRGADTPITVALQGEWGSGKTSLMNVLHDDLCGEDGKSGDYFPVWINTWEYSLMRDSNETLLQILYKMASEVVSLSTTKREEVVNSLKKGFIGFGTAITRGVTNKLIDGMGDGLVEALTTREANSVSSLRENLQEQISSCMAKNQDKKGIIFFIDDLDRIDPPVAVELLELLKNIFTLEHCIFILAIDYDVVIKGLKPKFGDLNEKNEREFRSFFDKIIQVPFSMPVSQYSTKDYLLDELKRIEVIDSSDASDNNLVQSLTRVEALTIGANPRSIKRFLNTLSLIKCINKAKAEIDKTDGEEQEDVSTRKLNIFLNLAIVGIQVAYPKVYQLLCLEPGFTSWDDTIASKMGIPRIDEQTKERLKNFEEFDEEWEQVLYRLCLTDKYLQNNSINISQLLNDVRKKINSVAMADEAVPDGADDNSSENSTIKEYMQNQMRQSSITDFAAGDNTPLVYDQGQLMRDVQWKLYLYVRDKFKNVNFKVPKVYYNGGIRTDGDYPDLKIWQNQSGRNIRFQFRMGSKKIPQTKCPQFMPDECPTDYVQDEISTLKDKGLDLSLFSEYFRQYQAVAANNCYKLWVNRRIFTDATLNFDFNFDVTFDNPEAFLEPRTIKTMQEVTRIFFDICFKLHKM